jgi:hypothetical protein
MICPFNKRGKKISMYNSHIDIGARKVMRKGGKISGQPQHTALAGDIAKSAHVYPNHYFFAKKKKTLLPLFAGATTENFHAGLRPA